jgi:hypothetical protein
VLLAGLLHSCGGDKGVTSPFGPTAPSPAQVTLIRLDIVGLRAVAPGESIQLRVVGQMSDGSTASDLGQVQWQIQHKNVASVDTSGLLTGLQSGETLLVAVAKGRNTSTQLMVIPTGTFKLTVVVNEGSSPALDVRVEVLAGVGAGLFDVTSEAGRYVLYGVAGAAEIRVSGNGYRERKERLVVTEHTVVTIEVVPLRDRVDVSGTYTLSIEGDAACQARLSSGLGSRRYTAVVTQSGPNVTVSLSGANFNHFGVTRNTFLGRIDGQNQNIVFNVTGIVDPYYYYDLRPDVMENLGDGVFLYFFGGAVTSISGTSLSGTFKGRIRHVRYQGPFNYTRLGECSSTQASFVLSR